MSYLRRLLAVAVLGVVALLAPATAAGAATPVHAPATLTFTLLTPNTATAPAAGMMAEPGDWMGVTGRGWFQPATGAVHAGGTFAHHHADGAVHCRGTWTATDLTGWRDLGPGPYGLRRGTVSLLVDHVCETMGETHTGIPMTVTADGGRTGVTVGEFTVPTGGAVAIRAVRVGYGST